MHNQSSSVKIGYHKFLLCDKAQRTSYITPAFCNELTVCMALQPCVQNSLFTSQPPCYKQNVHAILYFLQKCFALQMKKKSMLKRYSMLQSARCLPESSIVVHRWVSWLVIDGMQYALGHVQGVVRHTSHAHQSAYEGQRASMWCTADSLILDLRPDHTNLLSTHLVVATKQFTA